MVKKEVEKVRVKKSFKFCRQQQEDLEKKKKYISNSPWSKIYYLASYL
jgi:hypothetical protein